MENEAAVCIHRTARQYWTISDFNLARNTDVIQHFRERHVFSLVNDEAHSSFFIMVTNVDDSARKTGVTHLWRCHKKLAAKVATIINQYRIIFAHRL